jgi:hypothetical protein
MKALIILFGAVTLAVAIVFGCMLAILMPMAWFINHHVTWLAIVWLIFSLSAFVTAAIGFGMYVSTK